MASHPPLVSHVARWSAPRAPSVIALARLLCRCFRVSKRVISSSCFSFCDARFPSRLWFFLSFSWIFTFFLSFFPFRYLSPSIPPHSPSQCPLLSSSFLPPSKTPSLHPLLLSSPDLPRSLSPSICHTPSLLPSLLPPPPPSLLHQRFLKTM